MRAVRENKDTDASSDVSAGACGRGLGDLGTERDALGHSAAASDDDAHRGSPGQIFIAPMDRAENGTGCRCSHICLQKRGGEVTMTGVREVTVNKRSGDPRDVEIGKRMRALRLERGLSQTELGNLLGVTFQQIQKYEKGANRVAAGRLQRVAESLEVPITFFYAGSTTDRPENADSDSVDVGLGFLETAGAVRLVRAFSRIRDPEMRRALVELTEKIAG
jgi:transcriptional regulator with XRE-family HTH domain